MLRATSAHSRARSRSTRTPAIGGSATLGSALQCTQGAWKGDGPLAYAYQWSRDGAAISGASGPGYTVTNADIGHGLQCSVTATNPYGHATSTSSAVAVPPAPTISHLHQTHTRWLESNKAATLSAARKRRPPKGTTFSFHLNTSAPVTLTFRRCTVKRRHGHRKQTCKHVVGTVALGEAHPGTDKVVFAGRLSKHKKLKPGTYSVVITATNTSGKATSRALRFTIGP